MVKQLGFSLPRASHPKGTGEAARVQVPKRFPIPREQVKQPGYSFPRSSQPKGMAGGLAPSTGAS